MNQIEVYTTTDYFIGAYLITREHELKKTMILRGKESKAEFMFEGEHPDHDMYLYHTNRGETDALSLRNAYYYLQEAYQKALEEKNARKAARKAGRRIYE
jgi:hypothetical protein